MSNGLRTRIKAVAARLQQAFEDAGAVMREPDSLQPAEVLLDLYGEDIRARAYVTHDPVLGEQMLRPDFTVPIVQMHMAEGAEPARYTYNGPVWRKQLAGSARGPENMQVGFELFDHENPAAADAEVFALFNSLLDDWRGFGTIAVATGDIGILQAAVRGLNTTERRKAALLRHLWRPARFRQLLDRFGGRSPIPEGREALVAAAKQTSPEALVREAGPLVGLRTVEEIAARTVDLAEDLAEAPISTEEYDLLGQILSLNSGAVAALEACGRCRPKCQYYDGFVFGFYAEGRKDIPTLASGGRYDALTRVLGQGRSIPAIGGVFHPEALVALSGGAE
jgi:ATP phosphoribosyltransferase regulatory subunit